MYADTSFEFGYLPGFEMYGHAFGHYEQIPITGADSIVGTSIDLGAEGDLFKAPEPLITEPVMPLDPLTIISSSADIIADTIETEQLLNDVFYENSADIIADTIHQSVEAEQSLCELLDVKDRIFVPPAETALEVPVQKVEGGVEECCNFGEMEGIMQKSVSYESLNVRPSFLDFQGMDFEMVFGIRRSYSEGDIQNLGNNAINLGSTSTNVNSSFEGLLTMNSLKSEERKQKLSRYRKKKIKRNFGRKIKYACRKALADSQPRVRGRFAKIEECEIPRPKK